LLRHPLVQEDLKLTDDQKGKLKDLDFKRPAGGKGKSGSGSGKATTPSSRTKASGGANAPGVSAAVTAQQKQIDDLLDADQRKRLEQITLQVEGPLAVARPEVAKKINLSAVQLKQVRSIGAEMRNQLAELGPPSSAPTEKAAPGGDTGAADKSPDPAQIEQVREAAGARVLKVLKPAQKDTYNQLLGPTFDVAKLRATSTPAGTESASPEGRPKGQPKSRGPLRKSGGRNPS
jgi:hypothetical protein